MKLSADKLTGPQKAAILFLTMGEEYSTALFKELDEASIKKNREIYVGNHIYSF
jgi:flagellar motor switch protein FliG